ncbi:hypothetical protein GCM10009745_68820 [Kribbella yunnanensis]|uniref:Restriction endonuclease type IV Mrr domain-containing protein n=1 Tax=Kribbella yunnanensis TaxID=190194 RepID=A0ABN2ISP3_9ACTN
MREDAVVFSVRGAELTPEAVRGHIAQMRHELERQTSWANVQLEAWIPQLRVSIETAVAQRKERLDSAASLSAGLDIPLAPVDDNRRIDIPVTRKKIRFQRGGRAGHSMSPEPSLANEVYEDVTRTIGSLARAMERLPHTASKFKEVEIRDLILFILNSHWEGAVRGEVFNGNGKTDILLPWKDRNAFIGECKFWSGPKGFAEAIDQLLGYLVWQDTKAALILFIRSGEASSIIAKADNTIQNHPLFKVAKSNVDPAVRLDYVMVSRSDSQRFINLALLPVVIPKVDG